VVCEATGARIPPYAALWLAAFCDREAEAAPLIRATIEQATAAGQGAAVTWAHWAAASRYIGLGRDQEALAAARQAAETGNLPISLWARPELTEAAARTRNPGVAGDALGRVAEWTRAGGTD
jgi:hypothetical protein